MRAVGAATGLGAAAGTALGCAGAAVIGPDGACASVTSAFIRPSAANPVKAVSLKEWNAFMFNPEFARVSFMNSPETREEFPFYYPDSSSSAG